MPHARNDYLEKILKARVYDVAIETPLDLAPNLSARLFSSGGPTPRPRRPG